MSLTGKIAFCFILSTLFLAFPLTSSSADHQDETANYQLAITFDIKKRELIGTARIKVAAGETVSFHMADLKITGILLKRQDGGSNEIVLPAGMPLTLPAETFPREVYISYSAVFGNNSSNLISPEGITLIDNWHPVPVKKMTYRLEATIPAHFHAISESDVFPLPRLNNTVTAAFSKPSHVLHFAAAPYTINAIEVHKGLRIYTMFFQEEAQLADDYLKKAKEYIIAYENQVGTFPYNHYVIVANRLPTGLGMPTFTLLGQSVLRLPFIKDTSLRHEILHSWFGNSVDVDISNGNWCEGLTSYLADHAYRNEKAEGTSYRKETLINYLSYVNENNVIPLSEFTSASHRQELARPHRAVGYSRGLMLFSELETLLGTQTFTTAIREFYSGFKGKAASWTDIQAIFSTISGQDLSHFFNERLTRSDIPSFYADNTYISQEDEQNILNFSLHQTTAKPYSLHIPVHITTMEGQQDVIVIAEKPVTQISIPLPSRPLHFSLDQQYTIMRQLSIDELPPTWSRFMGSENPLILLESRKYEKTYSPLLKALGIQSEDIRLGNEVTNGELRDKDLLILGLNQKSARTLFGISRNTEDGFSLDVRSHPLNPDHVVALLSSSAPEQTAAVASRLLHYGKYSYLSFKNGRNIQKRITESAEGQIYTLEKLPMGSPTLPISNFDTIVDELNKNDVIYIGETHDSESDHRLQLRLIEAIAKRTPNIAIGMEMFPYTSQKALDTYLLEDSDMSEKEFLKRSGYFRVWSYNYRFFREIFQFAKSRKIPVIGLNLDRTIVSSVYRAGSTDELTDEQQSALPEDRNLDMKGYTERLRSMHSIHTEGSHGSGPASGFIQAQALWDETMSENIVKHLQENPGRKMVVLAGSQHTRKDSGIPPRVARRIQVQQASVLNILNGSSPANLSEIADYFFLAEPLNSVEDPKIGLVLNERAENEKKYIEIIDFSPHSEADEAGMQIGDIIVKLNGYPISTMEDIRIAMADTTSESIIAVLVARSKDGSTSEFSFEVKPISLPAQKPHP